MGTSQHSALLLLLLVLAVPFAASAAAGQPAGVGAAAKDVSSDSHKQRQQVSAAPVPAAGPEAAAAPPPAAPAVSSDHPPKRVAGVLLGLYQSYAGPVLKAASNFLNFGGMAAEPSPLTLPQCKQTNVLLDSGLFPGLGAWGRLSAEQQAHHPVNLVMMQVAYMAYRPLSDITSCLTGMGADLTTLRNVTVPVEDFSTLKTAYVFRAGRERVFVLFRGSCGVDLDLGINIACRQEQPAHGLFGVSESGPQIGVHRGYWRAWQSMEASVIEAVQLLLREVPSKEVYVVGHSLGAAMGSVAALRMNAVLPRGVSGVFMFAAPRTGNAAWAAAYNKALLRKTIRFSHHTDFAVRVPAAQQSCALGGLSLRAETGQFDYAHVGQAVLMCPDRTTGLTEFRIWPQGSDVLDCFDAFDVDATAATHQLGSYFDAWRRNKDLVGTLSSDLRVQAVLCQGCTVNTARFKNEQLRCPARAGGPVTCTVDANCASDVAFGASLAVGNITAVRQAGSTTCQAYMCQQPSTRG